MKNTNEIDLSLAWALIMKKEACERARFEDRIPEEIINLSDEIYELESHFVDKETAHAMAYQAYAEYAWTAMEKFPEIEEEVLDNLYYIREGSL